MPLDDLADRTCVVTGSSGFVGSWLVEKLVSTGARVRCLVRSTSRREFLPAADVEFALGDITDFESVRRATTGADYVFHVAGLIKATDEATFECVNVQGTYNVVSAASNVASIRRVLVVSSLAAAGPSSPDRPVDENWKPRPMSPYGASKLRAEELARSLGADVPVTIVRPPSVYGPRDRETLRIFQLASLPIRPTVAPVGAISAIHVADLADGIIRAASHSSAVGRTYFLTGDEAPSMRELLDLIAATLGRIGPTISVPLLAVRAAGVLASVLRDVTGAPLLFDRWKAEEIAVGYWACSNDRARQEIGFCPRIALGEGIAATSAWYRKAGWL